MLSVVSDRNKPSVGSNGEEDQWAKVVGALTEASLFASVECERKDHVAWVREE